MCVGAFFLTGSGGLGVFWCARPFLPLLRPSALLGPLRAGAAPSCLFVCLLSGFFPASAPPLFFAFCGFWPRVSWPLALVAFSLAQPPPVLFWRAWVGARFLLPSSSPLPPSLFLF